MTGYCNNVSARGIATAVPKAYLDNEKYADMVEEKRVKRQIKLTGIKHRHVTRGEQRTSDLVSVSAERLMEKLQWNRDEISVLVFVTQSPDLNAPSTAMLIQKNLGIGESCIAFDVNLGCSGFTTGMNIVASMLQTTKGKGFLLLGDCQHYAENMEYEPNALLFGDGGAAIALEYEEGVNSIYDQNTDGSRYYNLYSPLSGGRIMDGNAILLFSLNEVAESIKELHNSRYMENIEPDYYVLHQAQKIIMDGIVSNAGLPKDKFLYSYEEFGNTSSASIPISLCWNRSIIQSNSKQNIKIFACGYGIGLAWSSFVFDIDKDYILPVEETDYCYSR